LAFAVAVALYNVRANPDIDDRLYTNNKDGYFALQVYDDGNSKSLSESNVTTVDKISETGYAYEHPFEEMAYELSTIMCSKDRDLYPAVRRLL
jgi:hypothetical protein